MMVTWWIMFFLHSCMVTYMYTLSSRSLQQSYLHFQGCVQAMGDEVGEFRDHHHWCTGRHYCFPGNNLLLQLQEDRIYHVNINAYLNNARWQITNLTYFIYKSRDIGHEIHTHWVHCGIFNHGHMSNKKVHRTSWSYPAEMHL